MQKILNIAHRGFTKDFPDNTLEAFFAAIKLKVDGIECDVHETVDHHFVIFHDDTLNGKYIGNLSLSEISKVRLAKHYHIPTLEETLDLCHKHTMLMIELKQISSLDLFFEIVNARMRPDELFITSFNAALIKSLADFAPKVRRGILTIQKVEDPIKLLEANKAKILLPRNNLIDIGLASTLHEHQFSLITWDCNTADDMRVSLKYGVDGIITDAPDILANQLGR
jgi:glycerophosphoryl diester phosphodiesterase